MTYFRDSAELRQVLGGFFAQMSTDPEMGPAVRAAGVEATFVYTDPDLTITIDGVNPPQQGGDFNVIYGDPPVAAPITVRLSADNAHRFWQGKLNVMLALAQKQIAVEGSLGKLMGLLPAVQPAFARYRAYLDASGRADLLV